LLTAAHRQLLAGFEHVVGPVAIAGDPDAAGAHHHHAVGLHGPAAHALQMLFHDESPALLRVIDGLMVLEICVPIQ